MKWVAISAARTQGVLLKMNRKHNIFPDLTVSSLISNGQSGAFAELFMLLKANCFSQNRPK